MDAINIPFDIQEEIIKRVVAVKSLIRFRSVSKQWKSLIDSSEFITHHSLNHAHPRHLLIRYDIGSERNNFVSILDDDDGFPHRKFSPAVPLALDFVCFAIMPDCSHGVVCMHVFDEDLVDDKKLILLWNPAIRKSVSIVADGYSAVGFGVSPKTLDPTIVTLTSPSENTFHNDGWKAEVFTLSTGAWRSIPMNLPCMPFETTGFDYTGLLVDGLIYWFAFNMYSVKYKDAVIVSFGLESEEFQKVDLPDGLSKSGNLSLYKLKDSLALLDYYQVRFFCDVWMMLKDGSFTKLYTVDFKALDASVYHEIIGFRMNGQLIVDRPHTGDGEDRGSTLRAYDPYSKRIIHLEIDTAHDTTTFEMTSYTESLLLLNHPGTASIIQ